MFRFEDKLEVYLHRELVDFRLAVNDCFSYAEYRLGNDIRPCRQTHTGNEREHAAVPGT